MYGVPNQGAFTQADISAILANIQSSQWTGNTYYIDRINGLDLNNGQQAVATPGQQGSGPVRSFEAGYALLTSGNNDTLIIMGNGLATGSVRLDAAFTFAKNACRVIGICPPALLSQRARIAPTGTTTAFANFFTVSGSGNYFVDLQWFHGFNTGVAAAICMTVTGGRNTFERCHFAGMGDTASVQSATSRSLKISGTGENLFVNCTIGLDTTTSNAANASLEFAGATPRNIFINCVFPRMTSSATTLFILAALAGAIDRFQYFKECIFMNAASSGSTTMTGLATLPAAAGGMLFMKDCSLIGCSEFGTDATSRGQIFIDGGTVTAATSGIAVNPT